MDTDLNGAVITRIRNGLRFFFLLNIVLRLLFGILAAEAYPVAADHLLLGAIVTGILYLLVSRVPVDVVIIAFGMGWSIQVMEFIYLFGFAAGFQLLMGPLIFAVFLFEHRSLALRVVMAVKPLVGVALIMPMFLFIDPIYSLSETAVFWFQQINLLLSIGFSLAIIVYFALGLHRQRESARREARRRTELVRDLSHELKTPLAAMLTRTQVEFIQRRE